MKSILHLTPLVALAVLLAAGMGCNDGRGKIARPVPGKQAVPEPINLMLPQSIRIHPFTGTRTFDDNGGVTGIDVRIEALDAYGDGTKSFGDYRFELYTYQANSSNAKGDRIAVWNESLMEPEANLLHWDKITRTYEFKLKWDQAIPVGKKFVLQVVYSSPFTQRLFAERTFVSGQ